MADEIEAARRRAEQLRERLQQAPVRDVVGLVGGRGAGGGHVPGEAHWTLNIRLAAWRLDGAFPQQRPMVVRKQVSEEELRRLMRELGAYGIVRFRARVIAEPPTEDAAALLEGVPEVADDPALRSIAARLQEPVTFQDPSLGTFTLDRRIDRYAGRAPWCGKPIDLQLPGAPDELRAALATAHALWKEQERWSTRITQFAVDSLLDLKNSNWLEEDEDGDAFEVTADEFKALMKLEGISVYDDGTFDLWHQDGDLFLGHCIQVSGNLKEGPTRADIPG